MWSGKVTVSDERFVSSLKKSDEVVRAVAEWLRGQGYEAVARGIEIRPNFAERWEYSDEGDIIVRGNSRVEVKHREQSSFTYRSSWEPENRGVAFVDEVYKIDRKNDRRPPLLGYVIVNREVTHVAMISADTRQHWQIRRHVKDKRQGDHREIYACPLHHVRFRSMSAT